MFLIIGGAAFLLGEFVKLLAAHNVSAVVIWICIGLEHAVFLVDALLFSRAVYVSARRLWKELDRD
jgi:hypothetical protein